MLHEHFRLINEEFYAEAVLPEQMDSLWSHGWRHFSQHFFRYNIGVLGAEIRFVLPLRIRLADFAFSKSQRRLIRKNSDLAVDIGPACLTADDHEIFHRHKSRFDHSVPDSLTNFMPDTPEGSPCRALEVRVKEAGRTIAVSYFDIGGASTSGVYGMFEPELSFRGLGIFTLLKEIEWSIENGFEFYYLGYAYNGVSFYDYKKRFRATEAFDWRSEWLPFSPEDA